MSGSEVAAGLGSAPRIAVVKLGALGDIVYAFPLASALRTRWPSARLVWIVEARMAEVPTLHPGVGEVATVDTRAWRSALRRGAWGTAWNEVRTFARSIGGVFDLVIDAQGLLKSGVVTWLTRAPVRLGFSAADCRERGNAWFMTHHADAIGPSHAVRKNLALAGALGLPVGEPRFEVSVPEAGEVWSAAWHRDAGPDVGASLVTLHPGAGHPGKRWPLERWVDLSGRLARSGRRIALVAGPDDREAVAAAARAAGTPAVVATPPTVGALAALVRRASLVVAGDTGPLHLAAALGRRTVGVYGPSDPVTAGPAGTGHAVIKEACACGWQPSPSFNRRCSVGFRCLREITVHVVSDVVEKQLAATG